ncbi:MAG: hypothetical protein L0Z62_11460 [Gemmataceae bacterium]|nr:hypothetical protein [Gemmataceae bacterium]
MAVAVASCERSELKRGHVHGTVTVDGVPLAKGQIRLFALSAGGAGTDGAIVDGKYDIPTQRGPSAGTYRVEIESWKPTGRRVHDPDTRNLVDEYVNVLPARYHTQSTLQVNYDPGSDQPHNFEIKSK